jgi:hypothetical protein
VLAETIAQSGSLNTLRMRAAMPWRLGMAAKVERFGRCGQHTYCSNFMGDRYSIQPRIRKPLTLSISRHLPHPLL